MRTTSWTCHAAVDRPDTTKESTMLSNAESLTWSLLSRFLMVTVLASPAFLAAQGPSAPAAVDTSRHRLGMVTVHGCVFLIWTAR